MSATSTADTGPSAPAPAVSRRRSVSIQTIAPHLILLIVLAVTFTFAPGYRSTTQVASLLQLMGLLGVVAIGQNLAILVAGIDLSVGAVMTLTNLVTALVMAGSNANMPLAMGLTLLIGLTVGLVNGVGIALLKVPDMVMTLATMTMLLGTGYLITGGVNKGNASPAIVTFMQARFAGVLTGGVVLWVILGIGIILVLRKSVFGMQLYAVGLSRRAAQASGVRVAVIVIAIYVISGVMSALAGLMLTGYIGSSYYDLGGPYQLKSIAAVVIGGTSIFGGVGGYGGTFSGVGAIVVLLSFLQVVGLSDAGQQIAYGAVLLLMLILFARQQRKN